MSQMENPSPNPFPFATSFVFENRFELGTISTPTPSAEEVLLLWGNLTGAEN